MKPRKSYGQFCAVARSLDRLGDRWTLLILRELLLGPTTYRGLLEALDGISPNLLTDRLTTLAADDLVERNDAPRRSKSVVFRLTTAGAAFEPVIREMIRWGARWMIAGPGDDRVDPRWATLALRALLNGTSPQAKMSGVVHVDASGTPITIELRRGVRSVRAGLHSSADARISADMPELLAVASGLLRLTDLSISFHGDASLLEAALTAS